MDWSTAVKAISLPFSFNSNGAISYTEDPEKIWKDRVVLTVMTVFNERVMRPGFGSEVKFGVFENVEDALSLIKQAVSVAFSRWLTELGLVDVSGELDKTDNYLVLTITYSVGTDERLYSATVKTSVLSRAGELLLEVSNG
jgi:phage baseplate assembly protein W